LAAAWAACALSACAGAQGSSIEPLAPPESGITAGQLDRHWALEQLRRATVDLHAVFAHEGSEGILRLRLRDAEVRALFADDAIRRIERTTPGLSPTPGEQRWAMFARFVNSPLVGFCARGARLAERNGPDGLRRPAFVVDRLLVVGSEPNGYWGAWVEGLILTSDGWRLLPSIPFERQVEMPRRDHADVTLWDCDMARRPQGSQEL
jgi:hypothetical protein